VAAPASAAPAPPAAASAAASGAADAGPAPGPASFDPTTLNPNENGRLRVDAGRMLPLTELILVMDGKLFLRRTAAEFKEHDDDMFVPPGVHEFRVRARVGQLLKISNIVSTDFQAKKRKTLRIETRLPPAERGKTLTGQELAALARVFVEFR
jgi:hypothetical protein